MAILTPRQELEARKKLMDQGMTPEQAENDFKTTQVQNTPKIEKPKTMGEIDTATARKTPVVSEPVKVVEPTPVIKSETPKTESKTVSSPVVNLVKPKNEQEVFDLLFSGEKIDTSGSIGQIGKKRYLTAKAKQFTSGEALLKDYSQGLITDKNIEDIGKFNPDAVTRFKELKTQQDAMDLVNDKKGNLEENILEDFQKKFDEIANGNKELLEKKKEILNSPEITAAKTQLNQVSADLSDNRLKQQEIAAQIEEKFSGKATASFINAMISKETRELQREEQRIMNRYNFEKGNLQTLLDGADQDFQDLVSLQELERDQLEFKMKLFDFTQGVEKTQRDEYNNLLGSGAFNDFTNDELNENDLKIGYPVGTSAKLVELQKSALASDQMEQDLKMQEYKLKLKELETEVEKNNFKKEVAVPTGKYTTQKINGRNITLDETAAGTLYSLNQDLLKIGLDPLQINDSYRSEAEQAQIIRNKAKEFGINSNGLTINEIAEKVRKKGFQVANPGESNHQSGMSVDIPGEQVDQPGFIETMKKHGWYQLDDAVARANDRGHFDFKGTGNEPKPTFKTIEQGKVYTFATRMLDANVLFQSLEGEDFENNPDDYLIQATIPILGTFGGTAFNTWKSEKEQKFDQAKRNFINATLRRESGATISPEEFENAEIQYFPQPGDAKSVLKQKRENRERQMDNFFMESGNYEMKDIEKDKIITRDFYDLSLEVGDIYNKAGTGAGVTLLP